MANSFSRYSNEIHGLLKRALGYGVLRVYEKLANAKLHEIRRRIASRYNIRYSILLFCNYIFENCILFLCGKFRCLVATCFRFSVTFENRNQRRTCLRLSQLFVHVDRNPWEMADAGRNGCRGTKESEEIVDRKSVV